MLLPFICNLNSTNTSRPTKMGVRGENNFGVSVGKEPAYSFDPFFGGIKKVQSQIVALKRDIETAMDIQTFLLYNRRSKNVLAHENRLLELNQSLKRSSNGIRNILKELEEHKKFEEMLYVSSLSSEEEWVGCDPFREDPLFSLKKRFFKLTSEYSTLQSKYNDKLKNDLRKVMLAMGSIKTDAEFEEIWNVNRRPMDAHEKMVNNIDIGQMLCEPIRIGKDMIVMNNPIEYFPVEMGKYRRSASTRGSSQSDRSSRTNSPRSRNVLVQSLRHFSRLLRRLFRRLRRQNMK